MPPPGGLVPGSTTAWFWVTERPRSAERSSHTDRPDARRVAADLLVRVDRDQAYANVLVPKTLDGSGLSDRDRGFVTELVYGTLRRRRACDHLVDRFLHQPEVDPPVRALLRLGAYQLVFLGTPPHAAVSATVAVAPKKVRGLVNAVLRRVAEHEPGWPDDATRLSYPDWILARMTDDLGEHDAREALEVMNQPASARTRPDGYVQDLASEWVADEVEAAAGQRVVDLCAAPGGKATATAATGAFVVAADRGAGRVRLLAARRGPGGGTAAPSPCGPTRPWRRYGRPGSRVFWWMRRARASAPCAADPMRGWRIDEAGVERLAALQRRILGEAVRLVEPGGLLVYSVCTMTTAETLAIDRWLVREHPDLEAVVPTGSHWRSWGRGGLVLPQDHGTDGMAVFRYRRSADARSATNSRAARHGSTPEPASAPLRRGVRGPRRPRRGSGWPALPAPAPAGCRTGAELPIIRNRSGATPSSLRIRW